MKLKRWKIRLLMKLIHFDEKLKSYDKNVMTLLKIYEQLNSKKYKLKSSYKLSKIRTLNYKIKDQGQWRKFYRLSINFDHNFSILQSLNHFKRNCLGRNLEITWLCLMLKLMQMKIRLLSILSHLLINQLMSFYCKWSRVLSSNLV